MLCLRLVALRWLIAGLALLLAGGGVWCSAAENAAAVRDFGSAYPAGCNADEARAIYERQIRTLRGEQRAAIEQLASGWERELDNKRDAVPQDDTPAKLDASRKLLAMLRSAVDADSARLLALQHRSRLAPRHQQYVATIVDRLSPLIDESRRAKLAYQPYLAESIRKRWPFLDQSAKREMLSEYFRLAGEEPDWLLLKTGNQTPLPLAELDAEEVESFELQTAAALLTAEKAFQTHRDAVLVKLRAAPQQVQLNESERVAVEAVAKLLDAPYAKGFRGMMLLEPDAELPASLREEVVALYQAFRAELDRLRSERATQLDELKQLLAAQRATHLEKGEFAKLMAIDIRLDELQELVRPMRILAHRAAGVEWPEQALLLDVRGTEYRVRFLRDRHEAWLPRAQVELQISETPIRDELAVPAPAVGPGRPLTDRTALREGRMLLGYHNHHWYPVVVVDECPFGVVIRWEGFRGHEQVKPRSQLRLQNGQ